MDFTIINNFSDETTSVNDITPDSIEPDSSLQVLKDALNRATDLLTSPSSVTDDQSSLSPTLHKSEQYPLDNATEGKCSFDAMYCIGYTTEMSHGKNSDLMNDILKQKKISNLIFKTLKNYRFNLY